MKKGIFFTLLLIGNTSFIKTDEPKLTPIQNFQKEGNENLQKLVDALANDSRDELIELFISIQVPTEQQDMIRAQLKDPQLSQIIDMQLQEQLMPVKVAVFQSLEKFLSIYKRTVEDTESLSVSALIPVVVEITIDGKVVDSINNIPLRLKFDSFIATAKENKKLKDLEASVEALNKK